MSVNPIAVETAFTIDRRGIYYAVIASLGVHLSVLFVLFQFPAPHKTPATQKPTPPVRIQLSAPHKPTERMPETRKLIPIATQSKRWTPANPIPRKRPKAPKKLRITKKDIRAAIDNPEEPDGEEKSLSDNGAIVMNRNLLARLNLSERRLGIMADDRLPGLDSSFSGGVWTDYVQIGKTCFRVVKANPLEPISRDTWYRVQCNR